MNVSLSRKPAKHLRRVTSLLLVAAFAGALSTGYWILTERHPEFEEHLLSGPAMLGAALSVTLTTLNLLLRWLRFHFLVRRHSPSLVARDSLAVYLATLPTIMSPFFVAELVRVPIIARRFGTPASYLLRTWLSERLLDVAVVGCGLLLALRLPWAWAACLASVPLLFLWFKVIVVRKLRDDSTTFVLGAALLSSIVAWLLPMSALYLLLNLMGADVSFALALRAFATGTLLGGVSGVPLGVFITGSTMIQSLTAGGVASATGVVAILIYRATTAWYAILLGAFSTWVFRTRLLRLLRGADTGHFDELSSEYEGEIPVHVRDRLLLRKIKLSSDLLEHEGVPSGSHGLDVGCGQGWYLAEMRSLGYRVDGTDYSQGQLDKARTYLARRGFQEVSLKWADASALPYESESFDFVYSINAVHHMIGPGTQMKALQEIARVLKPGGVFLLHEMNTENPLFRWYMGYLFPLLKRIDEGNEEWLRPTRLPPLPGGHWSHEIEYFTFLPDFIPAFLLKLLRRPEKWLENSRFRRFSAHYVAHYIKDEGKPS